MAQSPDIQEQLKRHIRTCGMSPYALARAVGVDRSLLSYFLNGRRSITMDTAAKLAKVLDLELVKRKGKDR